MDLIKSVALVMSLLLAGWMAVTLYCQWHVLRHVEAARQNVFKRAVRKWDFELARQMIAPEGLPWLAKVEMLLRSGMVLLAISAFMAIGIILFGPELTGTPPGETPAVENAPSPLGVPTTR